MVTKDIVDAHQHFWVFDPIRDTWMNQATMSVLRRDYLPGELQEIMLNQGISQTIAVQADQSEAETLYLLDLAEQYSFIAGVVGWIDLKAANLEDRLDALEHPKLVGYRHIMQGEEPGFIADPNLIKGIAEIGKRGLTYDILVYAHQLEEVITLIDQCPGQSLIINHIAKPKIAEGQIKSWEKYMRTIASYPNVYCKLSGMITEANWTEWKYEDLLPYLDIVLESFGQERCVYGSDWPVCNLAGDYGSVLKIIQKFVEERGLNASAIFSENALTFYQLPR